MAGQAVTAILVAGTIPVLEPASVNVEHHWEFGVRSLRGSVHIEEQTILTDFRRIGIAGHHLFQMTRFIMKVKGALRCSCTKSVTLADSFPRVRLLRCGKPQLPHRSLCVTNPPEQRKASIAFDAF